MSEISIKHRLEWYGVRFFYWTFRKLGRQKASQFGGWLAQKVGPLLGVHKMARANMKRALPELDDAAIDRNLDMMWSNLGKNIGELAYINDIIADPTALEVVGQEYLDEQVKSGKGAFYAAGHFGPWELGAAISYFSEPHTVSIYRVANNPLVEEFFQSRRENPNLAFVPKGVVGARAILRVLREKGKVVMMNDQKNNTGISVPFFGRGAMTAPAVAEIAYKKDVPIYPMRLDRLGDGKYRFTVYPALDAPKSGDHKADVFAMLKLINETYEDWIRERPDHWFWVHNRWPSD